MPDPIFAHQRLALIYDDFEPTERIDLNPYVAFAHACGASSVLDVGSGTGHLATRLASEGFDVTGVDPALASIHVAQAKPFAEAVTWVHGDASAAPPGTADVAFMTGNVAQAFTTDEAWEANLSAISTACNPEGFLMFETRRVEGRAWERWTSDRPPRRVHTTHAGLVERRIELLHCDLPLVAFRLTYEFLDTHEVFTSDSTLRFRSHDEICASLERTGWSHRHTTDAPDRPHQEFVVTAQRR